MSVEPPQSGYPNQTQSSEDGTPQHSPNSSDISQDNPIVNFAPRSAKPTVISPLPEDARKGVPLSAATSRHIQDLETQINVHKKQCDEYREQLAAMEKVRSEKDRYQTIIEKLQSKLQPQSQELSELKSRLKQYEQKLEELQSTDADHETELEMATLDREMAEEHAEAARMELDTLKERMTELQDEVEVLREENNLMGEEVDPGDRSSQGWLQLEQSNERLKEALIRLREITQDKEAELTAQVSSLEDDLKQLSGISEQYEETRTRLTQSEAAIENLKEQLDEALDTENTAEKLTAENMALQDQMDQLRMNIKELEDLRELNDELEFNHVEAEKQMQEELDFKDAVLSEHKRHGDAQDEKLIDYEYTINKFRELVTSLQSGLEDMRASQQISDVEAEELNSRSKAMNDLNLKLQSSAAKAEMNTIDLEARRLEAQEAIEHLAIVQMFLPDSFKTERESVLTYLRFRRVASKSRLLHSLLKAKVSTEGSITPAEDVFTVCDMLDKLVWIAAMCDRFVSRISGCSLDEFSRYESVLYELDPVERGLNIYIDGVRRGDLKKLTAAEELQRTISLLLHLAEVHLHSDDLADYAENVMMRTSLIQSYLENTAVAMSFTRSTVVPDDGVGTKLDSEDSLQHFNSDAQALIAQTRSAKVVASKVHQALSDLKARSMSLEPSASSTFADAEDSASALARLSRQLGSHLRTALASLDTNPIATEDATSTRKDGTRAAIRSFTSAHIPDTTASSPLPVLVQKLKHTSVLLTSSLESIQSLTSVSEFIRPDPPWNQRAAALKAAKNATQDTEAELLRLKDTLQSQTQQIKAKDHTLEESAVKIELLEARTKDAAEKASRIAELSNSLEDVRKRERDMLRRVEGHAAEVATLSAEKEHWRGIAETRKAREEEESDGGGHDSPLPTPRGERASMRLGEVEALRAEVESLTGAVKFLREEGRKSRLAKPDEAHMAWLAEPLFKKRGLQTQGQRDEKRRLRSRGVEVLDALRSVVRDSEGLVDISVVAGAGERLKHRPMREKTGWKVARQREEWVLWSAMGRGLVRDCEEVRWGARKRVEVAASVDVGANGHALQPSEGVKSKQAAPDSGEQFHEAIAVADGEGGGGVGLAH